MKTRLLFVCYLSFFLSCYARVALADIKLASTTSAQNSGLYDYLIPLIEKDIDERISVIAVGTGQALQLGKNGDADLLLVHAPNEELAYLNAGHAIERRPIMYNHFVIVGPINDPANIRKTTSINNALKRIANTGDNHNTTFISRGDNSGTHIKETQLWQKTKLSPNGKWYLSTGSSMGATLNFAAAKNAYTLTDTATWQKFANKQELTILFSDAENLLNQYSVILLSDDKHPHLRSEKAKQIADWLTSEKGQTAISHYMINNNVAFIANAHQQASPRTPVSP